MTSPFEDAPSRWTGPPLTDEAVRRAEEILGVRLPQSYLRLLFRRNGGVLRHTCHPTSFRTSWAEDHFAVDVILGIGYEEGVDSCSADLVIEWGYPEIGVVIGVTPAAGHDTVMLDYSDCGPQGEPAVAYIGEDRVPRRIADSFGAFVDGLVPCETFDDEEDGRAAG